MGKFVSFFYVWLRIINQNKYRLCSCCTSLSYGYAGLCIVCESFSVKLTFVAVHDKKESKLFS
jgi:hypothetical protein